MMQVIAKCPKCDAGLPVSAGDAPSAVKCGRCGTNVPLDFSDGLRGDTVVDRCPVCAGGDFYTRKDFDPKLGLTVVIVGASISAAFYWFGRDLIAYSILAGAALGATGRADRVEAASCLQLAKLAFAAHTDVIDGDGDRDGDGGGGDGDRDGDGGGRRDADADADAPDRKWCNMFAVMAGDPESSTPGLIPEADFYAIDIFYADKSGAPVSDTAHLLRALDMLEAWDVKVVNLSLAGPRDELVASAVSRARAWAPESAGRSVPISSAMMETATSSSTRVKALDVGCAMSDVGAEGGGVMDRSRSRRRGG